MSQTPKTDLNGVAIAGVDQSVPNDRGYIIYFTTGTDAQQLGPSAIPNLVTNSVSLKSMSISIPVSELLALDNVSDSTTGVNIGSTVTGAGQFDNEGGIFDYVVTTVGDVRTLTFYSYNSAATPPSRQPALLANYEALLDALYFRNINPDTTAQRNFTVTYTDIDNVTATPAVLRINAPDTTAPLEPGINFSPPSTDFTPTITGTAEANSTVTVVIAGATYTTTADSNGEWTVDTGTATPTSGTLAINTDGSYEASVTATDAAGNVSVPATQNLAIDTTAPTFVSAETSTDGTTITLLYSEELDVQQKAVESDFIVLVGGQARTVTGVMVNGSTVELTLSSPITGGQTVTVAYTDPTSGNDMGATQDFAGNDAASISPAASVTNNVVAADTTPPTYASAATSTDGTKVILTYDEALSATTAATGDFVVNVGGSPVTVRSVAVNGLTVELTLQLPVTSAQAVTVAYTDPNTGSNDTNAVQDAAGNDAVSFTAADVANSVQSGGNFRPYIWLRSESETRTVAFTEKSGPDDGTAAVGFSAPNTTSIWDGDSSNLVNLSVSIPVTGVKAGDELRLDATVIDLTSTTGTGTVTYGGNTFSYSMVDVSGARTVIFTGSAPKASYEALLDALKYNNTSNTPDTTNRVFTVNLSDGTGSADTTATLTVTLSANTADDNATAPTASATTATITPAGNAVVQSTETGTAYLVRSTVTVTNLASITTAADANWNQVSITATNTDTNLAATGLSDGTYKVYTVDAAGNLSSASTNSVVVDGTPPHGTRVGVPSFAAPVTNAYGLTDVGKYATPSFADIDGDGDLDALVGNSDGDMRVFLNTGNATSPEFAAPGINPYDLTRVTELIYIIPSLVDIDSDGDLDVFVSGTNGSMYVFTNTGNATNPVFAAYATNPYGFTSGVSSAIGYASLNLADIDGDGDLDAFVGYDDGNTLVYLNTGTATAPAFAAPVTNPYGLTNVGTYATPSFADIDGDGDLDALVGNKDGNTLVYLNTGSATAPAFAAPVTNRYGLTDVGAYAHPSFADIDGDGDLDVFIGNSAGNTLVYINEGSFVAPVTSSKANGTYGVGTVITLTVTFNEAVIVAGGTPTLLLETGATDRAATYVSGSGTTSLTFTYTVQAGDTSADLDIASAAALALNGSTIQDAAGNNAILTLATPGAPASLAAAKALVIGTTAPADPPAPTPDPEPTPAPAPEPVVPAPAPAPAPATNTETIDGTTVQTGTTSQTNSSGQTINTTTQTVTPVSNSRPEDPGTVHGALADIPLVKDSTGQPVLTVSLPIGVGVVSESIDNNRLTLREKLILASDPRIALPADFQEVLDQGIDQYVPSVNDQDQVTVRTVTLTMPTAATAGAPTLPIVITGASGTGEGDSTHPQRQEALVIDARQLPSGTVLQFDKVEFAIIIGPSTVLGGEGRNFVIGDGSSQTIVLGPDDDVLRGGDGNDTIGSKGGDDQLFSDAGNDWVVGGIGNDTLQGGDANDILQGGASDAGTWTFKLNTQGQLQANFIPSSTELADSTGFAATGQWTMPAGQPGFVSDERVKWVYSDYSVVKDLALLGHALVGRLPTLTEMGAFAGGQFSSQQLGDMVNDYFARTHNIQTQTLDSQLSTVINQVWGSNASTPALVNLGKDYLAAGGTWANIWLALARNGTNAGSITDAQGNVSLINQTLGETGWSANPGNNQLWGGAGNDVITGGAGSNLIDGGTGTDMAVYVGTPNDYQVALTPSTEAGAVAGAHDALIRNKFTGAVDTVRNVELLKMGAAVYTVPFDQFQPTNNVYVELADYVQLTEQNLVLVGFVPAQLV